jgi:FkbM family methyltransferase
VNISINIKEFLCDAQIRPFLMKVFAGEYEVPIYMKAPKIIDLGANCGAFAVWASHRWPGCAIHCYEPHPKTFKFLEENTKDYPRVSCHNWAIGEAGLRPLYNGMNNSGESTLYPNMATDGTGQHVTVMEPDTLPEADIIKLDIEASELHVLTSLIFSGRKFKAIMFEYHNNEIRRALDSILTDYILTGSEVSRNPEIGVLRYIHKEML